MTTTVFRGGSVVCPRRGSVERRDLVVRDGRIIDTASGITDADVVDVGGHLILPGAVDLAVHLSDPGHPEDETLNETLAAAVRGGVTTFNALPDTDPVVDNASLVEDIRARAAKAAGPNVVVTGAMTVKMAGTDLADMGQMRRAGAVAFADVHGLSSSTLRSACEYARSFDAALMAFGPHRDLSGRGVIAEGAVATRLGLPGVPVEAETVAVFARIELARLTQTKVCVGFLSSARAAKLVEDAQHEGVDVVGLVSPWHLHVDESEHLTRPYDTALRLSPPLRIASDRDALASAVRKGSLLVASDHRALSPTTKEVEMAAAADGAVALPVALPLLLSLGALGPLDVARAYSHLPAQFLGRTDIGHLDVGATADVVVVRTKSGDVINRRSLGTPTSSCPMTGFRLDAAVVLTMVGGETRHRAAVS